MKKVNKYQITITNVRPTSLVLIEKAKPKPGNLYFSLINSYSCLYSLSTKSLKNMQSPIG